MKIPWIDMPAGVPLMLAIDLPFRDGPARVAVARGDLTGAVQIYRRLSTVDPSQNWTAVIEPRYVLEVARLSERLGEKEAAREAYGRFLDFWKDADAGLPEPAEARRAVARLRSTN